MAMNPPRHQQFRLDFTPLPILGPIGGDLVTTTEPACGTCRQPYTNAEIEATFPKDGSPRVRRLRIKCNNCSNRLWWLWSPNTPSLMTRQLFQYRSQTKREVSFALTVME